MSTANEKVFSRAISSGARYIGVPTRAETRSKLLLAESRLSQHESGDSLLSSLVSLFLQCLAELKSKTFTTASVAFRIVTSPLSMALLQSLGVYSGKCRKTLRQFKSRCITPTLCRCSTALASCRVIIFAVSSSNGSYLAFMYSSTVPPANSSSTR